MGMNSQPAPWAESVWGQTLTFDMIHLAFSKVIERALKQRGQIFC